MAIDFFDYVPTYLYVLLKWDITTDMDITMLCFD